MLGYRFVEVLYLYYIVLVFLCNPLTLHPLKMRCPRFRNAPTCNVGNFPPSH